MDALAYRHGALVFSAIAVFWAAHHVASLPSQPIRRVGLRGVARARGVAKSGAFRFVEPFLRWTAVRARPFLSDALVEKLDAQLTHAGDPLGLEPAELCAAAGGLGLLGGTLGAAYAASQERSPLYAVFLTLLFGYFPLARLQSVMAERALRVRRGLPAVVDLLCLGLSAGLDFPSSVRQVVDKSSQKDDVLAEELGIVLRELSLGKTRREALEVFAARNPGTAVQEFVASVIQAEEEGTPLAEVLQIQATVSRQRRGVLAEEAASKASLQLLIPMVLAFFAVFLLIGGPIGLRLMEEFTRAK